MVSIIQDFLHLGSSSTILHVSIAILLLCTVGCVLLYPKRAALPANAPPRVNEGWPILGAMRFFTARWDFFRQSREQSPTGNFSFHIGAYNIVGLSGDKGRQVFFEHKGLSFNEGYI
jgi:hypothetical protein